MFRATYRVRARVWLYPGDGGWHFASLSPKQSRDIRDLFGPEARGFGSIPVSITVGTTTWSTSLFPNRTSRVYMFAIKADVRRREKIDAGKMIRAEVSVR